MASAFEKAFAAARKAGKKEFSYNGKKYNTKLKEEVGVGKSVMPKKKPGSKPMVDSTAPAQPKNTDPIKPLARAKPTMAAKDAKADRAAPKKTPSVKDLANMTPAQRAARNAEAAKQRALLKNLK